MNTQTQQTESLDALVGEFSKRIARVIVAQTMHQLFSGNPLISSSGAPLSIPGEITSPHAVLSGEMPHRRMRRSTETVDRDVNKIVAALMGAKSGMRAEDIREATGLDKAGMLLPMKRALETGQITKTGNKRATVYNLPARPAAAEEPSQSDSIPIRIAMGGDRRVIRRKKQK